MVDCPVQSPKVLYLIFKWFDLVYSMPTSLRKKTQLGRTYKQLTWQYKVFSDLRVKTSVPCFPCSLVHISTFMY